MAEQDDPVIASLVQKLIAENASDDDIRAVIQEHKGTVAGKNANLGTFIGREATPQNFKLPAQQYNTPRLTGEKPARPETIGAEADVAGRPFAGDQNLGARAVQRIKNLPESADTIGGFFGPVGGAAGALARDLNRANNSDPRTPRTGPEAAWNVAKGAGEVALLNKAVEGGGWALGKGGEWIAKQSDPLIQAAVKPAIAELRRMAGSAGTSMAGEAKRIANLIRTTGLRTPEATEKAIREVERRVQDSLGSVKTMTDAPERAMRYLQKVSDRAAKQGSPADDLAAVGHEVDKFKASSPYFKTVEETVEKQVPSSILDEAGRPVMKTEASTVATRVPRDDVSAKESFDLARGTNKNQTQKAWGKQGDYTVESHKAIERAGRDAAKAAAKDTPLAADLKIQGDLLKLKPILDRFQLRTMNRDALSLPGVIAGGAELAHGKMPFFGMLAQTMRNQQLPLGVAADKAGKAVQRGGINLSNYGADTARAGKILLDMILSQEPQEPPK